MCSSDKGQGETHQVLVDMQKLFKYYINLFGLLFGHFPTKSHDFFEPEAKPNYIIFSNFLLISLSSYLMMINMKVLSMQTVFFAY